MITDTFDNAIFVPFENMINETTQQARLIAHLEGLKRLLFRGEEGSLTQKASVYLTAQVA